MRTLQVCLSKAAAASAIVASVLTSYYAPSNAIMPFQQFETAGEIPDSAFRNHVVLHGRVEKIVDGDTLRIRHYPFYPLSIGSNYQGRLSDHTMTIRAYGVDCPEVAKFGKPSQPFGDEAKQFTTNLLSNKVVHVKLLRKDQYNRAVGNIQVNTGFLPFFKKDLSEQLAEQGLALLYTGGGAEYDDNRSGLEAKIENAKRNKRGMWSLGEDQIVTPAQFKRDLKQAAAARKEMEAATTSGTLEPSYGTAY